GVVGCPVCKREYEINEGVVQFGPDPLLGRSSRSDDITVEEIPDPEIVQALLALQLEGGYVVLVGSVTRLANQLAERIGEVHFVGVNPPPDVTESTVLSLLQSDSKIPLKAGRARGCVIGEEYAEEPWLTEAGRVLMTGQRMVVANESATVSGVNPIVADRGLWVGVRE
ncbi:MAG: hypothetical protein JSW51_06195, partial [Gemmatimonadota bacterium]